MANSFLSYTNDVLVKLNEVKLTSTDFTDDRGIQTQAKNAVNQAIRYICLLYTSPSPRDQA